jgi:uncharacterized repeat protein (TIGR01451 family)
MGMKPLLQPFFATSLGLLLTAASASGQEADLNVWGTATPSPVRVGETLALTVWAHNGGPDAATNVEIKVKLPLDASYISGPGCIYAGSTRTVTCTIGPLGVSATQVAPIVRVQTQASGMLAFDVSVTGNEPDPDLGDNQSVVPVVSNAASDGRVEFLTVRSSDGKNLLEWLSPPVPVSQRTVLHRTESSTGHAGCVDVYETNPLSSFTRIADLAGAAGAYGSYEDTGLPNDDLTYCYTAFVCYSTSVCDATSSYTLGRTVSGRPFATSGPVKWAFGTEGGAVMPSPALNGHAYVISGDTLYAVRQWQDGGSWPSDWKPFRFYPAPAALQRPTVTSAPIGAAPRVALVGTGTTNGRVYAIDGGTGTPLWQTDPLGADTTVQAGISGLLKYLTPTAPDVLLVGTVNGAAPNSFAAIQFPTGSLGAALPYSFTNSDAQGGDDQEMGVISGQAAVDSLNSRVYFGSRKRSGGSDNTMWALRLDTLGSHRLWAWDLGEIDGSPTLRRSPAPSTVYVGTNDSRIHALDPETGEVRWSFAASDGAVKSLVWAVYNSRRLHFATRQKVWALDDTDTTTPPTVVSGWPVPIPSPSTPVLFFNTLYVGSSDGHLYQIDPAGTVRSVMLGDGSAAVGTPSIDYHSYLVYVGTLSGHIYAVSVPF